MVVSYEETISFAKENLGKEVRLEIDDVCKTGMIVGYGLGAVIISFTDCSGWEENEIEKDDVILLHSPLNVTYWYWFDPSYDFGKKILDACCGSRMFWFDKNNPDCLFMDKRRETLTAKDKDKIRTIEVNPDLVADFTDMPFDSNFFYMVVFDPPHMKTLGDNSWMAKKYGKLPDNWKEIISKGFDECMRVLKPNGTLIFKWNESEIKVSEILSIIPYKPLFGHTSGKQSKTIWMCFMKD